MSAGAGGNGAREQSTRAGARVAVVFLVFGVLWILLSDRAIAVMAQDAVALTQLQTLKGWAFVLGTALLLFFLVAREVRGRLEQEERFHRLAQNLPDMIYRYRVRPDPGFEYVNPAAAELTGYAPEDLCRDPGLGLRLAHPDDRPIVEAVTRGEVEPGKPVVVRWIRRDGQVIWIEQRDVPILDQHGTVVAVEGIARDITARRAAEQTLAEERTLLRRVMETSPVGILLLDRDGIILFGNSFAERLMGLTRSEMEGRSHKDESWHITTLEGAPFPEEELPFSRAMATGGAVADIRLATRSPDGSPVLLSVNAAPIKSGDGTVTGVVAIMDDITQRVADQREREKTEARLIQAQKLEAVGRLAGGIAHDFNNMLGVIMMAADLALLEAAPESAVQRELGNIQDAAERSAELTRQLLAFSRKQVINPRTVNLNRVVADREKMLGRIIGEEVTIRMDLEAGLWDVFIDPSQMDQILTNLLVNARDAIKGTGTVTIETANVELDESQATEDLPIQPGDFVLLSVTDSGAGMSGEVLAQIFEPFFTTKAVGAGTGLGLSTVYGVVRQNAGAIQVYSEPGLGTTFKIYLPRHQGAAEVTVRSEELPAGGHETVLVVEDEAMILDLARRCLEHAGYRVLEALGPEAALQVAGEHDGPIHLLLTDVILPGINGKELAERIGEIRPETRTLFMSGYPSSVIAQRGVLDGGVSFLQKPFTPRYLTARVRETLDREE